MALIEYDVYKQKLRELSPELDKLSAALDIESASCIPGARLLAATYGNYTCQAFLLEPLSETIRGFREIIEGKYDSLPESAFLFVGTIDEAVEKAKKVAQ